MKGILKHDLYSGIYCLITKILTFGLIFFVAGIMAINQAKIYGIENLSLLENLTYVFYGCKPFINSAAEGEVFTMPVIWMVIQLYLAYIIGGYPLNDMNKYGINLLVRTKSRTKWWMGKVIWGVLITAVAYVMGYLVILLLTLVTGGDIGGIRPEAAILYNDDFSIFNNEQMFFMVFLFPMITSISVSVLQMTVMFLFNEVIAYGMVGFLFVAGAFYESPFLLSSNSMTARSINMVSNNSYEMVVSGTFILIIISIVIGTIKIKKKNIYDN